MSGASSTEPEIHKGLVGVVSHRSSVSSIIGTTLTYRSINIDDLTDNGTFEEIVYLLWHGRLPTRPELATLQQSLREAFPLPPEVIDSLRSFPKDTDPMRVLQAGMAVLGMHDPDAGSIDPDANLRKAVRATAQLTTLNLHLPSPSIGQRTRHAEPRTQLRRKLLSAPQWTRTGRDRERGDRQGSDPPRRSRTQRVNVLGPRHLKHAV